MTIKSETDGVEDPEKVQNIKLKYICLDGKILSYQNKKFPSILNNSNFLFFNRQYILFSIAQFLEN
jgi:hypothetical protein